MFCDEADIYIKAGDGGNGAVSFHREKFVAKGPPDGGDGGKGSDIVFQANNNINTLSEYRTQKHFNGDKGENGAKCNRTGASGEDLILEVPVGTQVYDAETNELLFDLSHPEDRLIIARGGKGGLGNAHFVSSVHQAPHIAELGEPGAEKHVKLELKLVADCGIIGFPNAGKSTLISVVSNARPKIADYPFTTVVPNLGVVHIGDDNLVMCDVPGLIEDAHEGKGLGDTFLKHIERTKVLIHMLDITESDIVDRYKAIRRELESYSPILAKKKEIVVLNKIDVIDQEYVDAVLKELKEAGIKEVFPISAVTHKDIQPVLYKALEYVKEENATMQEEQDAALEESKKHKVFRPHLEAPKMSDFEVVPEGDDYRVKGQRIEQLIVMTDFTHRDAEVRVHNIMKKAGILKGLKKAGAEEGDAFWVGEKKFVYEGNTFENYFKKKHA